MSFTAQDVMTLRQRTGAGMMDCKKALTEANGDFDKAVDYLREKGIAKAAKKAGRIAAEGIVDSYIHMNGSIGVLIEVNCETDFVARGDQFKNLVHDIVSLLEARGVGGVCLHLVAEGLDVFHSLFSCFIDDEVSESHIGSLGSEFHGDGLADSSCGARYEGYLSV